MNTKDKAHQLLHLHEQRAILQVVNVWDVASARVVADLPGTTALATASHSIAATFGYDDGENIPLELMLDMCGRIASATSLPVSADLEAGYGDPGEAVRRAIGVGIVGANLEDQMKPLIESVENVAEVTKAAEQEEVGFVLNARTDAFVKAGDRPLDDVIADAIERGRAYLDAGAACIFVPGLLDEQTVIRLVEGIGEHRVSVINVPGSLTPARLEQLGVARISYGPWTQRVALTALQASARELLAGGHLPEGTQPLN
jgi:2-methylisocitrate lyase-like PEP mutase family enzyme